MNEIRSTRQTSAATTIQPDHVDVSGAVVEAVADAEGISPVDVSPPLYEAVDPDALEQFLTSAPSPSRHEALVTFTYAGYEVTVAADGSVTLA